MSIDQEKMIVEALPSLYPLKDYEEDAIHAVIDALPPSQPEPLQPWEVLAAHPEIVRCAECKWFQCNMRFDGYLPEGVDEFECRHWHGSCDPTDFCSQGTRREVTT